MGVVLLTSDLMVISRVEGAAARAETPVATVSGPAAALERCGETGAHALIIDLATPGLDLQSLVSQLKTQRTDLRMVAFGPHVHEDRLAAARAAGCDAVMSRGQFFAQVDSLLARR